MQNVIFAFGACLKLFIKTSTIVLRSEKTKTVLFGALIENQNFKFIHEVFY